MGCPAWRHFDSARCAGYAQRERLGAGPTVFEIHWAKRPITSSTEVAVFEKIGQSTQYVIHADQIHRMARKVFGAVVGRTRRKCCPVPIYAPAPVPIRAVRDGAGGRVETYGRDAERIGEMDMAAVGADDGAGSEHGRCKGRHGHVGVSGVLRQRDPLASRHAADNHLAAERQDVLTQGCPSR